MYFSVILINIDSFKTSTNKSKSKWAYSYHFDRDIYREPLVNVIKQN